MPDKIIDKTTDIPDTKDIYLDNAATSFPKPDCVSERVVEVLTRIGGNPGRASHRMALEAGRVIFEARESLGRLLNADPIRIAFTKSATESVNVALKGVLKPGDHVITTTFEHNSVAKTLRRLSSEGGEGIGVTKVSTDVPGLVSVDAVKDAVTDKTRLVTVVHASNVFGTIQPIEEIGTFCRERGILFMVDGAQTAGSLLIDLGVLSVDMFIGTGHKSLLGPQGTGFIYLREGVEPPPLVDGGTGAIERDLEVPERLEAGTMNTPGIGGLGAGIEYVAKVGVENVRTKDVALVGQIMEGLKKLNNITVYGPDDPEERSSLVAFNIAGVDPQDVGVILDREHNIMVRCGKHCSPDAHMSAGTFPDGSVRVSPGYFNTHDQIDIFLNAIRDIAKGKGA